MGEKRKGKWEKKEKKTEKHTRTCVIQKKVVTLRRF